MNLQGGAKSQPQSAARIRVFVDFWNFQLTMNEREARATRVLDPRVKIDWREIGPCLARKSAELSQVASHTYDGTIIYASHDPQAGDKKFYKWMTSWLNRQPGIHVECLARQPKAPPKCPTCHKPIEQCPHTECGAKMIGTIEKGVDTLIVTDMIRLAWEQAYDIAVLASSDRDLIPAVKFLDLKGLKVIQAGFPPSGNDLATACWASFDIYTMKDQIVRAG